MARKITVIRLEKNELEFKLKIRGFKTGTSNEMRSKLSMPLQLERSGESFRYPKYPFKYDVDELAVSRKCVESGSSEYLLWWIEC